MLDHPARTTPPPGVRLHLVPRFADAIADLHVQLLRLIECAPISFQQERRRSLPASVVYLFSEPCVPLYVGRTDRFAGRLDNHCKPYSDHNQASLAFLLAREELPLLAGMKRKDLLANAEFADAFTRAKARVGVMEIRYVEERDPVRQALLEIYCALALATPHNSFKNH